MIYPQTASAHKLFSYKNTQLLDNHRVWLPFHFLPGNGSEPLPERPLAYRSREAFVLRCVCCPNSHPARDLIATGGPRPYPHRDQPAFANRLDRWLARKRAGG